MSWKLEGSYFETCSCEVVCPCTASMAFGASYDRCRVTLVLLVDLAPEIVRVGRQRDRWRGEDAVDRCAPHIVVRGHPVDRTTDDLGDGYVPLLRLDEHLLVTLLVEEEMHASV